MRSAFLIFVAMAAQAFAGPIQVTGNGTWFTDFELAPQGPGRSSGSFSGTSSDGRSVSVFLGDFNGNSGNGASIFWGTIPGGVSCTIDGISASGRGPIANDPRPICTGSIGPGGGSVSIYDLATSTIIASEPITGIFSFTQVAASVPARESGR